MTVTSWNLISNSCETLASTASPGPNKISAVLRLFLSESTDGEFIIPSTTPLVGAVKISLATDDSFTVVGFLHSSVTFQQSIFPLRFDIAYGIGSDPSVVLTRPGSFNESFAYFELPTRNGASIISISLQQF